MDELLLLLLLSADKAAVWAESIASKRHNTLELAFLKTRVPPKRCGVKISHTFVLLHW